MSLCLTHFNTRISRYIGAGVSVSVMEKEKMYRRRLGAERKASWEQGSRSRGTAGERYKTDRYVFDVFSIMP